MFYFFSHAEVYIYFFGFFTVLNKKNASPWFPAAPTHTSSASVRHQVASVSEETSGSPPASIANAQSHGLLHK